MSFLQLNALLHQGGGCSFFLVRFKTEETLYWVDCSCPFRDTWIERPIRHTIHRTLVERAIIYVISVAKHRFRRIRIECLTRRLLDTDVPDLNT